MKITHNIEPEVEITQRIAYSVSALMKLNIISEVIKTDNANLLSTLENNVHMVTTAIAVVTGGFGRRAAIKTTPRAFMQSAHSVCMAAMFSLIATLFGPLYG